MFQPAHSLCLGAGLFPDAGCLHTARLAAEKVVCGGGGGGGSFGLAELLQLFGGLGFRV